MNYANQQRDLKVDLVKGMGIILMVFRHTEAPYSEFVLLFHMAIFFIASGYLFKPSKLTDIKTLISYMFRKIKSLWLPYFGFSAIFILTHNLLLQLDFITANPQYLIDYTGRYAELIHYYSIGVIIKNLIKAIFFMSSEQLGEHFGFFMHFFW